MTRKYAPRRASRLRWLKNAPEYILDCFKQKESDGFDILFCGSLLGGRTSDPQDFSHVYIMGLELTASGAWCSFELSAYEATQFRYRNSHYRIAWSELPSAVRKSVTDWAVS